jgi:hypothetical protein
MSDALPCYSTTRSDWGRGGRYQGTPSKSFDFSGRLDRAKPGSVPLAPSKPPTVSDNVAPWVKPTITSKANTERMTQYNKLRHGTAAGNEVGQGRIISS